METLSTLERKVFDDLLARRPDLDSCTEALVSLHKSLVRTYDNDGKLLACGNGGSHADATHLVGELCKSFERMRPIDATTAKNLEGLPWGDELLDHLEQGLAAITLGLNGSVKTAIENDSALRDIAFAQEAYALGKPGDVFLAISTSGNATNCLMALSTAKAIGCTTVALTGPHGGKLAMHADISIKAPGESTKEIQEAHICLYHTFCLAIETHYFPESR